MAPRCEIRFHGNPKRIYHGGQTLTGSVELYLEKPNLVNDFRLVISGRAEVKWTGEGQCRMTFSGKEDLLHSETYLIPGTEGNTEIPAGVHVYSFTSVIPTEVPTSFEGKYGHIRYTVQAILNRPWKFKHTTTASFEVLKSLNLNEHQPTLKEHREEKFAKTFCCWPCSSSPLYVDVEIPMTGYVPRQKIPITVALNNTSRVPVLGITSELKRKVSYISQCPRVTTRVVDESLINVWRDVRNDEPHRYMQELRIPPGVPTGKCPILVIDYMVQVKVYVDDWHLNSKIKIPIIIGTIPFTTPQTMAAPTAQESSGSDDTLPPSYEEAMKGMAVDVNDGIQRFIPSTVAK